MNGSDQELISADTLFDGRLFCAQNRRGYRFSIDAVLAAGFADPAEHSNILDLGCGCGIIGLILAWRCPSVRVTGIELQPALAELARRNARQNGFADRCFVVCGDVRTVARSLPPESFHMVICNPPYKRVGTGRVSRAGEAAIARHELRATLADMVRAAAFAVRNRGRVIFVYPAGRIQALLETLAASRLILKTLWPVYSYPEAGQAVLVLVEAVKNGGEGSEVLAPLFLYASRNGPYSEEIRYLFATGRLRSARGSIPSNDSLNP